MYKGLLRYGNQRMPMPIATRQVPYRMVNKVHSVQVSGMGQAEYYGPPRPGQTWSGFQEAMTAQNVIVGSAIVGLAIVNPIIGGVALLGWLAMPRQATHVKSKSLTQGG